MGELSFREADADLPAGHLVEGRYKMAPLYRVRIKDGASLSGKDQRWRLYIGYGFKMALMYLVGIGNGLMMAPLYWTLINFSISILQILYIVKEICIL